MIIGIPEIKSLPHATSAFVESAYSGGRADANMVNATMIKELLKNRMTRRIQTNHRGLGGQIGTIRENRRIGVAEESFTRYHTVRNSSNTQVPRLRIV